MRRRKSRIIVLVTLAALVILPAVKVTSATVDASSAEAVNQITEILKTIPSGRTALDEMNRNHLQIKFQSGKGTFFLASDNVIVIDANHEPMRAALSFIHEINHASTLYDSMRANILNPSKEEYALLRVAEEAEGVVKSIEAKMELASGGLDVSELSYPLEAVYTKAYQDARNAASQRERGISLAELDTIGRAAGKNAVIDGFIIGRVLTSHTLETYVDFYGQCWQKANDLTNFTAPFGPIVFEIAGINLVSELANLVADSC